MKLRLSSILLLLFLLSCDTDRGNRNPFLLEFGFQFNVNLNLPLYSDLNFIGNPVFIDNIGIGIRGVYITNTGFNQFRVFEATCPNHEPNECSTTQLNGQSSICGCEEYEYSLFTGQFLNRPEEGQFFDMLEYRTSVSGNTVIISN